MHHLVAVRESNNQLEQCQPSCAAAPAARPKWGVSSTMAGRRVRGTGDACSVARQWRLGAEGRGTARRPLAIASHGTRTTPTCSTRSRGVCCYVHVDFDPRRARRDHVQPELRARPWTRRRLRRELRHLSARDASMRAPGAAAAGGFGVAHRTARPRRRGGHRCGRRRAVREQQADGRGRAVVERAGQQLRGHRPSSARATQRRSGEAGDPDELVGGKPARLGRTRSLTARRASSLKSEAPRLRNRRRPSPPFARLTRNFTLGECTQQRSSALKQRAFVPGGRRGARGHAVSLAYPNAQGVSDLLEARGRSILGRSDGTCAPFSSSFGRLAASAPRSASSRAVVSPLAAIAAAALRARFFDGAGLVLRYADATPGAAAAHRAPCPRGARRPFQHRVPPSVSAALNSAARSATDAGEGSPLRRVPERGHDHELLRTVPPEVAGHDAAVGDAVECGDDWQRAARVGEKSCSDEVLAEASAPSAPRARSNRTATAALEPIAVADEVKRGERRGRCGKLPAADDDATAQRAESCKGAFVPLSPTNTSSASTRR